MSVLKRFNGTDWEIIGGNIAPKTAKTNSDTDTYSCNYLNPNVITVSLSTAQNAAISSSYGATQIDLDTQNLKIGSKLTFDSTNHCVVIGSGVNHIEINANAIIANGSSSYGDRYLNIVKQTGSTSTTVANAYGLNSTPTNNHYLLSISPVIISVSENDKLLLKVSSAIVETISVRGGSGAARVYLTVKVID